MVKRRGRAINLRKTENIVAFVLFFIHESKIRSTFFGSLRSSPRVKIKEIIYLGSMHPNELNFTFSKIVPKGFLCDKL